MRTNVKLIMLISVVLLLSGCVSTTPKPVDNNTTQTQSSSTVNNGTHITTETESTNIPPRAHFNISTNETAIGEDIVFDASSSYDEDGNITEYTWDFNASDGIGTDAEGIRVHKTFSESGHYIVTLIVMDDKGATSTRQREINITSGAQEGETAVDIQCDEGNTGTLSIPLNPLASSDKTHHWDMPISTIRITVILLWQSDNWNLQLDVGTGDGPNSGNIKSTKSGSTGTISISYSGSGDLETGQWFAHIKILNPDDHTPIVDSVDYQLKITAYVVE